MWCFRKLQMPFALFVLVRTCYLYIYIYATIYIYNYIYLHRCVCMYMSVYIYIYMYVCFEGGWGGLRTAEHMVPKARADVLRSRLVGRH